MKYSILALLLLASCSSDSGTSNVPTENDSTVPTSPSTDQNPSTSENGGAPSAPDETPAQPSMPAPDPDGGKGGSENVSETPESDAGIGDGGAPVDSGSDDVGGLVEPTLLSQERFDGPEVALDAKNCDGLIESTAGPRGYLRALRMPSIWYGRIELCIISNNEAWCRTDLDCGNKTDLSCLFTGADVSFVNKMLEHGFAATLTDSKETVHYKLQVSPFNTCEILEFKGMDFQLSIFL